MHRDSAGTPLIILIGVAPLLVDVALATRCAASASFPAIVWETSVVVVIIVVVVVAFVVDIRKERSTKVLKKLRESLGWDSE